MMRTWIDTLATTTHRTGFLWRARREATRLRQTGGAVQLALAEVLEAVRSEPPPEEAAWHRQIEALRHALLDDSTTLSFHDYGVPHRLADGAALRTVTRAVRDVCRSSAPPHEGRLLFHLIRRFRPETCLELGTCLGLSAAYQATALSCNGAGRLISLEGGTALAERARLHLHQLGLTNTHIIEGRFQDTMPEVLAVHAPIDYVFIDGHHDPVAMLNYHRQLRPYLASEAVLVFDDIAWSAGMRRAWRSLAAEASIYVDLFTVGLYVYRCDLDLV